MPSPMLSRPIYTLEDCKELLRLAEAFLAKDRNTERPHVCECDGGCADKKVEEMCLLCQTEGLIGDARCLIGQHEIAQRRSPCGCPYRGQTPSYSWVEHTPKCRAEQAAELEEMRRPT